MAFWSQGSNFADARRPRNHPARTAAANLFRDRDVEINPDTSDMFFETTSAPVTSARNRWAERMASSAFDDFPVRRMGSANFSAEPPSFGSLHRRRPPPSWMSDTHRGSKESSPASGGSDTGSLPRHATFHRADSIPVHVTHESRQGSASRSSTPESTGSCGLSSKPSNGSADDIFPQDGVEEHPMPASRAGKQGFTARHQPKVHHIPIHVEPRDLPPAHPVSTSEVESPSQSQSPPVYDDRRFFANADVPSKRAFKDQRKSMASNKARQIPIQKESEPEHLETSTPPPISEVDTPPVKPKKKTPFETLDEVLMDVDKLRQNVAEFTGTKGDKHYMFLDEMLTRCLIRLDNIETEGNEELRMARRAVIVSINECIGQLEKNAISNENNATEKAEPSNNKTEEKMELESSENTISEVNVSEGQPISSAEISEDQLMSTEKDNPVTTSMSATDANHEPEVEVAGDDKSIQNESMECGGGEEEEVPPERADQDVPAQSSVEVTKENVSDSESKEEVVDESPC